MPEKLPKAADFNAVMAHAAVGVPFQSDEGIWLIIDDNHIRGASAPEVRMAAELKALRDVERDLTDLRAAAKALYEEVQMAESVGICLPDRVACVALGDLLHDSIQDDRAWEAGRHDA